MLQRALASSKNCKYGGIVREVVFVKVEYIRREFAPIMYFTHNLLLVLVLYSRMAFLQESALKEALKSFSMLPKGEGMNNLSYGSTRDGMFSVG